MSELLGGFFMGIDFELGPRVRELNLYIKRSLGNEINSKVTGVTHANGLILLFLREAEAQNKKIFQKDLEMRLKVNKSTMSEMLDCMERNDLIKRIPLKEDNRKKQIVFTPHGREVDQEVAIVVRNFDKKLRSKISTEELDMFLSIIKKLQKEGE